MRTQSKIASLSWAKRLVECWTDVRSLAPRVQRENASCECPKTGANPCFVPDAPCCRCGAPSRPTDPKTIRATIKAFSSAAQQNRPARRHGEPGLDERGANTLRLFQSMHEVLKSCRGLYIERIGVTHRRINALKEWTARQNGNSSIVEGAWVSVFDVRGDRNVYRVQTMGGEKKAAGLALDPLFCPSGVCRWLLPSKTGLSSPPLFPPPSTTKNGIAASRRLFSALHYCTDALLGVLALRKCLREARTDVQWKTTEIAARFLELLDTICYYAWALVSVYLRMWASVLRQGWKTQVGNIVAKTQWPTRPTVVTKRPTSTSEGEPEEGSGKAMSVAVWGKSPFLELAPRFKLFLTFYYKSVGPQLATYARFLRTVRNVCFLVNGWAEWMPVEGGAEWEVGVACALSCVESSLVVLECVKRVESIANFVSEIREWESKARFLLFRPSDSDDEKMASIYRAALEKSKDIGAQFIDEARYLHRVSVYQNAPGDGPVGILWNSIPMLFCVLIHVKNAAFVRSSWAGYYFCARTASGTKARGVADRMLGTHRGVSCVSTRLPYLYTTWMRSVMRRTPSSNFTAHELKETANRVHFQLRNSFHQQVYGKPYDPTSAHRIVVRLKSDAELKGEEREDDTDPPVREPTIEELVFRELVDFESAPHAFLAPRFTRPLLLPGWLLLDDMHRRLGSWENAAHIMLWTVSLPGEVDEALAPSECIRRGLLRPDSYHGIARFYDLLMMHMLRAPQGESRVTPGKWKEEVAAVKRWSAEQAASADKHIEDPRVGPQNVDVDVDEPTHPVVSFDLVLEAKDKKPRPPVFCDKACDLFENVSRYVQRAHAKQHQHHYESLVQESLLITSVSSTLWGRRNGEGKQEPVTMLRDTWQQWGRPGADADVNIPPSTSSSQVFEMVWGTAVHVITTARQVDESTFCRFLQASSLAVDSPQNVEEYYAPPRSLTDVCPHDKPAGVGKMRWDLTSKFLSTFKHYDEDKSNVTSQRRIAPGGYEASHLRVASLIGCGFALVGMLEGLGRTRRLINSARTSSRKVRLTKSTREVESSVSSYFPSSLPLGGHNSLFANLVDMCLFVGRLSLYLCMRSLWRVFSATVLLRARLCPECRKAVEVQYDAEFISHAFQLFCIMNLLAQDHVCMVDDMLEKSTKDVSSGILHRSVDGKRTDSAKGEDEGTSDTRTDPDKPASNDEKSSLMGGYDPRANLEEKDDDDELQYRDKPPSQGLFTTMLFPVWSCVLPMAVCVDVLLYHRDVTYVGNYLVRCLQSGQPTRSGPYQRALAKVRSACGDTMSRKNEWMPEADACRRMKLVVAASMGHLSMQQYGARDTTTAGWRAEIAAFLKEGSNAPSAEAVMPHIDSHTTLWPFLRLAASGTFGRTSRVGLNRWTVRLMSWAIQRVVSGRDTGTWFHRRPALSGILGDYACGGSPIVALRCIELMYEHVTQYLRKQRTSASAITSWYTASVNGLVASKLVPLYYELRSLSNQLKPDAAGSSADAKYSCPVNTTDCSRWSHALYHMSPMTSVAALFPWQQWGLGPDVKRERPPTGTPLSMSADDSELQPKLLRVFAALFTTVTELRLLGRYSTLLREGLLVPELVRQQDELCGWLLHPAYAGLSVGYRLMAEADFQAHTSPEWKRQCSRFLDSGFSATGSKASIPGSQWLIVSGIASVSDMRAAVDSTRYIGRTLGLSASSQDSSPPETLNRNRSHAFTSIRQVEIASSGFHGLHPMRADYLRHYGRALAAYGSRITHGPMRDAGRRGRAALSLPALRAPSRSNQRMLHPVKKRKALPYLVEHAPRFNAYMTPALSRFTKLIETTMSNRYRRFRESNMRSWGGRVAGSLGKIARHLIAERYNGGELPVDRELVDIGGGWFGLARQIGQADSEEDTSRSAMTSIDVFVRYFLPNAQSEVAADALTVSHEETGDNGLPHLPALIPRSGNCSFAGASTLDTAKLHAPFPVDVGNVCVDLWSLFAAVRPLLSLAGEESSRIRLAEWEAHLMKHKLKGQSSPSVPANRDRLQVDTVSHLLALFSHYVEYDPMPMASKDPLHVGIHDFAQGLMQYATSLEQVRKYRAAKLRGDQTTSKNARPRGVFESSFQAFLSALNEVASASLPREPIPQSKNGERKQWQGFRHALQSALRRVSRSSSAQPAALGAFPRAGDVVANRTTGPSRKASGRADRVNVENFLNTANVTVHNPEAIFGRWCIRAVVLNCFGLLGRVWEEDDLEASSAPSDWLREWIQRPNSVQVCPLASSPCKSITARTLVADHIVEFSRMMLASAMQTDMLVCPVLLDKPKRRGTGPSEKEKEKETKFRSLAVGGPTIHYAAQCVYRATYALSCSSEQLILVFECALAALQRALASMIVADVCHTAWTLRHWVMTYKRSLATVNSELRGLDYMVWVNSVNTMCKGAYGGKNRSVLRLSVMRDAPVMFRIYVDYVRPLIGLCLTLATRIHVSLYDGCLQRIATSAIRFCDDMDVHIKRSLVAENDADPAMVTLLDGSVLPIPQLTHIFDVDSPQRDSNNRTFFLVFHARIVSPVCATYSRFLLRDISRTITSMSFDSYRRERTGKWALQFEM